MTHTLLTSVLFNFQVFRDFPTVTDFWVDSLVIRKHALCDLISSKFVEISFRAEDMVSVSVLWTLEKNVYFVTVGWSCLCTSIRQCRLMVLNSSVSWMIIW